MTVQHPFVAAITAQDIEAAIATLDDDVVFHSPVLEQPFHGRQVVAYLMRKIWAMFQEFRYVRQMSGGDASDLALVFRARAGGQEVDGVNLLRLKGEKVADIMVMVRPMAAVLAVGNGLGLARENDLFVLPKR